MEPKPDPPSQVYPTPISDLPDPTGHFMPAAETPLPADLTARVAELEQLAQEAHANVRDLQAAKGEADILRQNYDSTSRQVESGEAAVKSGTRELDYLTKYNSGYLSSALASAQESQRFNGWIKVGSAIRAVVWDVASEKIIMPAIQQLPHYSAIDRANKAASLTRQVLSLEQNFELLSASAADVLALGSASDTENVMEQVFGSSREQMHDTVDKALDLIEAPPAAYKGWKAFFNASKDY